MKKINKAWSPNALTEFAANHPTAGWEDFRRADNGTAYQSLKSGILDDQGGLCAYCEQDLRSRPPNRQRLEHVHSKSDISQSGINWALDWNNVVAVCMGGSSSLDDDHTHHPLPRNLSCDAYKAHLEAQGRIPKANEGYILYIEPAGGTRLPEPVCF